MAIKNRLIGIQVNTQLEEVKIRKELSEQLSLYEQLEGVNSEGWKRVNEEILTLNDRDLKRRAGKYREFFEQNNEKPTSIFYRLGKEKNGDDDISQIRDNDGKVFESNSKREEHVSKFYENLYKKRIDNIMGIEDFLANGDVGNVAVEGKKLTIAESDGLEGEVTLGELTVALNKSNMNSSCGWDGISYWLIKNIGNL